MSARGANSRFPGRSGHDDRARRFAADLSALGLALGDFGTRNAEEAAKWLLQIRGVLQSLARRVWTALGVSVVVVAPRDDSPGMHRVLAAVARLLAGGEAARPIAAERGPMRDGSGGEAAGMQRRCGGGGGGGGGSGGGGGGAERDTHPSAAAFTLRSYDDFVCVASAMALGKVRAAPVELRCLVILKVHDGYLRAKMDTSCEELSEANVLGKVNARCGKVRAEGRFVLLVPMVGRVPPLSRDAREAAVGAASVMCPGFNASDCPAAAWRAGSFLNCLGSAFTPADGVNGFRALCRYRGEERLRGAGAAGARSFLGCAYDDFGNQPFDAGAAARALSDQDALDKACGMYIGVEAGVGPAPLATGAWEFAMHIRGYRLSGAGAAVVCNAAHVAVNSGQDCVTASAAQALPLVGGKAADMLDVATCSQVAQACATRHHSVTVWDALCSLRAMVHMPKLPFAPPADSDDDVGARGARRHAMCIDSDDE
jgi:hypothetical protein